MLHHRSIVSFAKTFLKVLKSEVKLKDTPYPEEKR